MKSGAPVGVVEVKTARLHEETRALAIMVAGQDLVIVCFASLAFALHD
jgi:hypothetical protein